MTHSPAAASQIVLTLTRTYRFAEGPHWPRLIERPSLYVTSPSSQLTSKVTDAVTLPGARWIPCTLSPGSTRLGRPTSAPGGATRTLPIVPATGFGLLTVQVMTHSPALKLHPGYVLTTMW